MSTFPAAEPRSKRFKACKSVTLVIFSMVLLAVVGELTRKQLLRGHLWMNARGKFPAGKKATAGPLSRRNLAFGMTGLVSSAFSAKGDNLDIGEANYRSPDEGVIKFVRLFVTDDGKTHLKSCHVEGLDKKSTFGTVQYVRDLAGSSIDPKGIVFTQQLGDNPWHPAPNVQFVITLSGAWYVNTTDGGYVEMYPGDVLYQDDSKGNPKNGTHYSGTLHGKPCNQMIISVAVDPEKAKDDLCDW